MRAAVLLALLPLGGCVTDRPSPERALADAIGPRIAGIPRNCVSTALLDQARIIDDRTIVYGRTGTIYVNTLRASCPGLRPAATIVTEGRSGLLCFGDFVSTRDPGSPVPGPKCPLGEFIPHALPRQGPG